MTWTNDARYFLPPEVFESAAGAQRGFRARDRGERLEQWKASLGREPSGLEILERAGQLALGTIGGFERENTAPRAPQARDAQKEYTDMGTRIATPPQAGQTRAQIMAARDRAINSWSAHFEAQGRAPDVARCMAVNAVADDYKIPVELRLLADSIRDYAAMYRERGNDPVKSRRMAVAAHSGDFHTASPEDLASLAELRAEGFVV